MIQDRGVRLSTSEAAAWLSSQAETNTAQPGLTGARSLHSSLKRHPWLRKGPSTIMPWTAQRPGCLAATVHPEQPLLDWLAGRD